MSWSFTQGGKQLYQEIGLPPRRVCCQRWKQRPMGNRHLATWRNPWGIINGQNITPATSIKIKRAWVIFCLLKHVHMRNALFKVKLKCAGQFYSTTTQVQTTASIHGTWFLFKKHRSISSNLHGGTVRGLEAIIISRCKKWIYHVQCPSVVN